MPLREQDAFDPRTSPLHRRVCFLVGAPRSGTTWVQQLLAAHPGVAASTETHMFDGLGTMLDNHATGGLLNGWVTRPQLVGLTRNFADGIMLGLLERTGQPDALVVEKTPDVPPIAKHLAEVYPDAAFVHLVRDGRDVAYSLRQRFGTSLPAACRQWVQSVDDINQHLTSLRYLEVRYEEIAADPVPGLTRIYHWLELDDADERAGAAVAGVDLPVNTDPSVGNFASARRRAWPRWLGPLLTHETSPALAQWGYVGEGRARVARAGVRPIVPLWRAWERSKGRRLSPAAIVERRRQRRIDSVLATTDAFFAAVDARDYSAIRRVVDDAAVLDVDGIRRTEVPAHEQLASLMQGWSVHARWAVTSHSMAELHPSEGGRAAVRLRVHDGKVLAIEVTTTELALHKPDSRAGAN